jgi:thiamine biosynthesis lipoprotein
MRRRRFLAVSAAFLAASGVRAETVSWEAPALGGVVRVDLRGPVGMSAQVARDIGAAVEEVEAAASLFRADSALCRLNAVGRLDDPPRALRDLAALAEEMHRATGGVFDPTVQPLWQALAEGRDPAEARALVGWARVRREPLQLAPGQALTFNGLAQGYAADRARAVLAAAGYGQALVDMGEFSALGGPFTLGIEDPARGIVATRRLTGGAIATSSPGAMRLGAGFHILGPRGEAAQWSTVSVEAERGAVADGLSTAFCLMGRDAIRAAMGRTPGVRRAVLVDFAGDVTTL